MVVLYNHDEGSSHASGGGPRRIAALDAVAQILAVRGYEDTRFADVSAASGVAISTLQMYFGSCEDMLIEAMRRSTDEEVERRWRSRPSWSRTRGCAS